MWLVTTDGFYSVVAHEGDDALLVRARREEHLAALKLVIPDITIIYNTNADYHYRAVVSRGDWEGYLRTAVEGIDYTSHFKEALEAAQPKHLRKPMYNAVLKVWNAFYGVQPL